MRSSRSTRSSAAPGRERLRHPRRRRGPRPRSRATWCSGRSPCTRARRPSACERPPPGVKRARALLKGKVPDKAFVDFVRRCGSSTSGCRRRSQAGSEPGATRSSWRRRRRESATALERSDVPALQSHYGAFLEGARRSAHHAGHSRRATSPTSARTSAGRRSCSARRSSAAVRRPSASRPAPTPLSPASPRERSQRPTTRSSSPACSRR